MTLEQAKRKIRNAWIVGLIFGFITLFYTLAEAMQGGGLKLAGTTISSLWRLLDVFLILMLTFGIFKKSRGAAIVMFIYFLIGSLRMWADLPEKDVDTLIVVLIGIVFLYFFFEGVRGATAYHELQQSHTPVSAPPASPDDR